MFDPLASTTSAFVEGVTAPKWITALRYNIPLDQPSTIYSQEICSALLYLLRFYKADATLKAYIQLALAEGFIPLYVLVANFMKAARAHEFQDALTLDMLCRLVLDSITFNPLATLLSPADPSVTVVETVCDSLAFLRLAYTLPPSPFHTLMASASDVVARIAQLASLDPHITVTDAMSVLTEVTSTLQTPHLLPDVRVTLEGWIVSLAQVHGANPLEANDLFDTAVDLVLENAMQTKDASDREPALTSLVISQMVMHRASHFGAGNKDIPANNLLVAYRCSNLSISIFCSHVILSAVSHLNHNPKSLPSIVWRSFILGRLPIILLRFIELAGSEHNSDKDNIMEQAFTAVFARHDLLNHADLLLTSGPPPTADSSLDEDAFKTLSFRQQLLLAYVQAGMITSAIASGLCSDPTDFTAASKLALEAGEQGEEVEAYLEGKISPETSLEDGGNLLERFTSDFLSHAMLSEVIQRNFLALAESLELEPLSHLAKLLYEHDQILDIISLHVPMSDIIIHGLEFVEDFDSDTVGDPQAAMGYFGDIVLFLQVVLYRFQIKPRSFKMRKRTFTVEYLYSVSNTLPVAQLEDTQRAQFDNWLKAVFDQSSDGIDDPLLRSTDPKTLLQMSATLLTTAMTAFQAKAFDIDALHSGISYFLNPLLAWTLVGVIKAHIGEIERQRASSTVHLEVLKLLILDNACPKPVLQMVARPVHRLLSFLAQKPDIESVDLDDLRALVKQTLQIHDSPASGAEFLASGTTTISYNISVHHLVDNAFAAARATPFSTTLDVPRCLIMLGPIPFLNLLWSRIRMAAQMPVTTGLLPSDSETSTDVATFALAFRASEAQPPLLPIFIQHVVPRIIPGFQLLTDVEINSLFTVLCGALLAVATWESLPEVGDEDGNPIIPATARNGTAIILAKRLKEELELLSSKSPASVALLERLKNAPAAFMAQFPVFGSVR